mmetsp:Transcript_12177/g.29076  ORF Transcript_12177/g.29076 Transcript_12177/m.29076 type:complete len:271 (+) Transcript_12177:203-1015(+)
MTALVLPLPSPLYALAKWAGFSQTEDEEVGKETAADKSVTPLDESNISNEEEQPMKIPAECVSLNTPASSVPSAAASASSGSDSGNQTPDTLEHDQIRPRHVIVPDKVAPTKRVLFSEERCGSSAITDESEDEATQRCAATLTRLMMLKNKLTGELAKNKTMDSVVLSTKDLKDENLKLRLEISELQKQVQERDDYIERCQLGWTANSWNPLAIFQPPTPYIEGSIASVVAATPRTRDSVMAQTCSTWLSTPVPLDQEALPGVKDKLVTL